MAGYIGKAKSLAVLAEQDPSIPSQTGNSGKYLTTDGTDASWAIVEALPDAIDVNASAPADSLVIDASGNLGVGTTSDGSIGHFKNATGNATLKVEGGTTAGNDAYANIEIGNTTGTSGIFFSDTTNGVGRITYEHNGDYMRMYTASTERMRIDSSGDLKFNSGYGSVATAYGCRAWVNIAGGFSNTFNRIGSGNVSSVTDNGSGDYTLNFATALPDTNYAVVGATCGNSNNGNPFTFELPPHYNDGVDGQATGSVRVYAVLTGANAKQDVNKIHVAVFR